MQKDKLAPVPPVAPAEASVAAQTPVDQTPFKVKATQLGFLNHRRRPGDVFLVTAPQFSPVWMERVDQNTPERSQSTAEIARENFAAILAGKHPEPLLQPNAADLEDEEPAGEKTPTGNADVLA